MATAAITLALLPLPAAAQGPVVGSALAERWCTGCHVIERAPRMATDSAPSFPSIAATPSTTADSLDRYLST